MTTMTTGKGTAQAIRDAIKAELGHNARAVSVREERCSTEWSFVVQAKTAAAARDLPKLEEIGKRFERIDRCEASGEILGGGNTVVSVSATSEAIRELGEPWAKATYQAMCKALDDYAAARADGRSDFGRFLVTERTAVAMLSGSEFTLMTRDSAGTWESGRRIWAHCSPAEIAGAIALTDARAEHEERGRRATVERVEITGAEEAIEGRTFPSVRALSNFLRICVAPKRRGGGYCKTWFRISFSDGNTYEGRIDVNPFFWDVAEHVRGFQTGTRDADPERYPWVKDEDRAAAAAFLRDYDLEG